MKRIVTVLRNYLIRLAFNKSLIAKNKRRTIVFIAPHPHELSKADGFAQRVNSIDNMFCDLNRIYIKIELKNKSSIIRYKNNSLSVHIAIYDIMLFLGAIGAILYSRIVYSHSIYGCSRLFDTILFSVPQTYKILDAHGLVPEERQYIGKKWSFRYKIAEFLAFKQANLCIFVTKNMYRHFHEKYLSTNYQSLILPIFIEKGNKSLPKLKKQNIYFRKPSFIYTGGTQPWQLIPKMLDGISKQINIGNYLILTPTEVHLNSELKHLFNRHPNIQFGTMSPKHLKNIYSYFQYSFILREEHPVNKCACPTKIIECLENKLIPILLTPDIGDFKYLGIKYLPFEDFITGKLLSKNDIKEFNRINTKVVEKLHETYNIGAYSLSNLIRVKTKNL